MPHNPNSKGRRDGQPCPPSWGKEKHRASTDFELLFVRLRTILQMYSDTYSVAEDTPTCFRLEANTGPAAVRAWGGKVKRPTLPVAWVEIGKPYVSYHLMGVYGNEKLLAGLSKRLRARMQGKTCFNFKANDEVLFKELEKLTIQAISSFKKSGFIA